MPGILNHLAHHGHIGLYRGRDLFRRIGDDICTSDEKSFLDVRLGK